MVRSARTRFPASVAAGALLVLTLATTSGAAGDPHYPPDSDHPLRIVHYFVHPVGKALEYAVTRPLARFGAIFAPYHHIDSRSFSGCSRERPARSCTDVIK